MFHIVNPNTGRPFTGIFRATLSVAHFLNFLSNYIKNFELGETFYEMLEFFVFVFYLQNFTWV